MIHNENKENYDETNINKRKIIGCNKNKNKNENISLAFNKLINYKEKKFKEISLSFPDYSNTSTKKLKNANNQDIKIKTIKFLL